MTIRVAMLIFVTSFAAITGWLTMRKAETSGLSESPQSPLQTAKTPAAKEENPSSEISGAVAISDDERELKKTLGAIMIPVIDLEDASLEEALALLNLKLRQAEAPSLSHLDFTVRKQAELAYHDHSIPEAVAHRVNLKAENISLAEAIERVCQQTGHHWSIEHESLVLHPVE